MKRRNLWKLLSLLLVLVAIPLFVATVAAEIYIRVTSPYGYVTPEIVRSRSLEYDPAVFARHVFPRIAKRVLVEDDGLMFQINALGYRGGAFAEEKPPEVTRIMVYGGSAAFDSSNVEGQDWPRLFESHVRESGFPNVEVINAGIPGHSSDDSVGRLFAEGHLFDPDYVLLYNAWNDIKDFRSTEPLLRLRQPSMRDPRSTYQNAVDQWLSEASQLYVRLRSRYYNWKYRIELEGSLPEGDYTSTLSPIALRQYKMNVETFVDVARNAGAEPVLITQGRLVARANTEADRQRIRYDFVLLTHEALYEAFEETDRILQEVSAEKGALLIDASSVLSGRGEFFEDTLHLTPLGSRVLADLVGEAIEPLLRGEEAR